MQIEKKDSLHELEMTISHILRGGVLTSGALLLVGWLWMWFRDGDLLHTFKVYESHPFVEGLHWAVVKNDRAYLIAQAGLILLVCLPLIRVLMTTLLFVRTREKVLAGMAFLVFVALVGSFLLGVEL